MRVRSGSPPPVIVWFRRDLRLEDHPALDSAAQSGHPVLPVFVRPLPLPDPHRASDWWLHGSLARLATRMQSLGGRLMLLSGDPAATLAHLVDATRAEGVFFNDSWQPDEQRLADSVRTALEPLTAVHSHAADCLHAPGAIRSTAGTPLRVFTPFWKACQRAQPPRAPRPRVTRIDFCRGGPAGDALEDWRLRPEQPDWAGGLRSRWQPGEETAAEALKSFLDERLAAYGRNRDRPDLDATSRLSAHLHFGEIGPRQVWHAVRSRAAGDSRLTMGSEVFLRELVWREFALHLLHHFPDLPEREFQVARRAFPWRRDRIALRAWQQGRTGYPLVDAGMRELWASGWMHNRVRMVAASFLVKHLLIDWREGMRWFADTLVDADLASNAMNWQWVAGCGPDAAPYFRIFNPVLQGRKFDPAGVYIRRWLPELARLPDRFLHAPWLAPEGVLAQAGIRLGRDYPAPMVDHEEARQRALAALASLRASSSR